jgi:DNA-binding MarR family transcriptional regulator
MPLPAANTGQLLYSAHRAARAQANRALRPLGIDLRGLGVLSVLAHRGPMSQRQLASAIDLDKSSMVLLVDALERLGLVERERAAHDRRAYALRITNAGRERLSEADHRAAATLDDFLEPLSARERQDLNALLTRLVPRERG